jgi:hypothetical protein
LAWGEVRLDCALEVGEAGQVNLPTKDDHRHAADFHFQISGQGGPD